MYVCMYVCVCVCMYAQNRVFFGPSSTLLYTIVSGVLQGCPGSGSLFSIALDPCLRRLASIVFGPGIARACADDVGVVLASLRLLRPLAAAYQIIQTLTGLALKPRKCIIVPCAFLATDEVKASIKRWLEKRIPQWRDFQVASAAKFLGAWIGPGSGTSFWSTAAEKYRQRTKHIIEAEAPPSIGVRLYTSRALSVLGYLMQFRELPDSLVRRQRYDAHALLRVPQSTFTNAALHTLKDAGAPEVPSLALVAAAARGRAALSTISVWKCWRQKLERVAVDRGPVVPALLGRLSPACWDTAPIAVELEAACSPAILRSSRRGWAAAALEEVAGPEASDPPDRGLQRKLLSAMRRLRYVGGLCSLILCRLNRFDLAASEDEVRQTLSVASRLAPELSHVAVSTLCNGWVTDRRMQEAVIQPCLFGCPPNTSHDCLEHYLQCEQLWSRLATVAPPALAPGISRCALCAVGSPPVVVEAKIRRIAAALHAYRSLRLSPELAVVPRSALAVTKAITTAAFKFEINVSGRFGDLAVRAGRGGSSRCRKNKKSGRDPHASRKVS